MHAISPPQASELHAWLIDLDASIPVQSLSAQEQSRASRFIRPQDAQRYKACRATLRRLLGAYLNRSPDQVNLLTLPQGKPVLGEVEPLAALHFNVSHSGNLGVVLVGSAAPVGVDIEWAARAADMPALVRQYMSDTEIVAQQALPGPLNNTGHPALVCWTRKEATLKALGCGLLCDPRSVSVGLDMAGQRLPAIQAWDARDIWVQSLAIQPAQILQGAERSQLPGQNRVSEPPSALLSVAMCCDGHGPWAPPNVLLRAANQCGAPA